MNELDTNIPPDIRLMNPISERFTINRRFTSEHVFLGRQEPGLNAKINCLFPHCHIFRPFLVSQSSFKLPFSLSTFDFCQFCYVHAGYLFVTDTLSTQKRSRIKSSYISGRIQKKKFFSFCSMM